MDKIIDVKKIIKDKKENLKKRVENIKIEEETITKVAVVVLNDDEKTKIFVEKKAELCEEIGIEQETHFLNNDVTQEEVEVLIEKLNKDDSIYGIILQLPAYKGLDIEETILAIDPEKDVEGLHPYNLGKLVSNTSSIKPCTPKGILTILESQGVEIEGKNVTIVGRSLLVGKPLAHILMQKNATVTVCHTKTKDLGSMTRTADILVVATGIPNLITEEMVKEGAIVIDVGINKLENGKVVGDVELDSVLKRCGMITPVPGGVGLTTVLSLVENIVEITENKLGIKYIEYAVKEDKESKKSKIRAIPSRLKGYFKNKKIKNIKEN